jgi:hypothetical protein
MEPKDRFYNDGAQPPEVEFLDVNSIRSGQYLAGVVEFSFDPIEYDYIKHIIFVAVDEDYSGELDVNSSVRMLSLQGIFGKYFSMNENLSPFLDFRGGLAFGWLEFSEKISFEELPELNTYTNITAKGTGFCANIFLGIMYLFNKFNVSAQLGYRYSLISEPEAEINIENQNIGLGKIDLDINFSGFMIIVSIGNFF